MCAIFTPVGEERFWAKKYAIFTPVEALLAIRSIFVVRNVPQSLSLFTPVYITAKCLPCRLFPLKNGDFAAIYPSRDFLTFVPPIFLLNPDAIFGAST